MDSQTRSKNPGNTNPKPYGSTVRGLKRGSRSYADGDPNNLPLKKPRTMVNPRQTGNKTVEPRTRRLSRQFWKAGDDKEDERPPRNCGNDAAIRVHPQFLHANATSHKWALGAFAELLDNSLDEACNGATYVHVDSTTNQKDGKSSMLIVQDNGGGMDPNRFRECLSLGYSRKRNVANTVGQYGNGFKTSTMRLGADAIIFTRSRGANGGNTTQSVGMLSYTYLYETRKSEAVVPTVDFELVDNNWVALTHDDRDKWFDNLETIVKWSPYVSQQAMFDQFDLLEEQGTQIVIYNLWDDDEGKLELDFDTDGRDIQLRGVNRDEKKIEMAKAYPNSRHFLTYRHSLRRYASILYLRLPPNFRIILRGKEVEHHSLLEDMMMTEDITYKPVASPELSLDEDMVAALKIGFVKDAHHHIDIQGFNVYHKNRLIKPFWRVWNAAGSDGRGVIGLLEANFIQPAHNKQGFERTALLARVENRLNKYQKTYWCKRCHEIGYAPRTLQKNLESGVTEAPASEEPAQCRPKRNSQKEATQPSVANTRHEIGLRNKTNGLGVSCKETRSVHKAAEFQKQKAQLEPQVKQPKARVQELEKRQKVRDVSAKPMVELQRQRTQKVQTIETRQVAELQRQKKQLELQVKQSKSKIQDLEKRPTKVKDHESAKLVVELQRHKGQLELQLKQSQSKIQDLEKRNKVRDDDSAKLVEELHGEKAFVESQLESSKAKIHDLEESQKVVDELVVELQRDRGLLESQLKVSQAKNQEFEKSQKAVMDVFQEERGRRDVTEDALRKKLRGAYDVMDTLKMKVNALEADQAFCKKVHMHML
ncbi:protein MICRORCHIDIA 5-like [Brassica rapa]|uniref:Morc S5 domain-containing protein n=1 Tax=Brassica campestris TaxID=3711 RepID=M4DJL2_BRACM|nr:protein MICRORCHIDIA 5-like [Brassica rapa]